MENKCKNCGHKKFCHHKSKVNIGEDYCHAKNCNCEKFEGENHSLRTKDKEPEDEAKPIDSDGSFNLSDKIGFCKWYPDCNQYCVDIKLKDVKEFISQDTLLIKLFRQGAITYQELRRRRNKLAGEKLK